MDCYELLATHKTVDPFVIAENLGISVFYGDFSFEGLSLPVKGKPIILLNDCVRETNRKYVIMAHELYHAIEHKDLAYFYTVATNGQGKLERECNQFTADLLYSLYVEWNGINPQTFNDLKYLFGLEDEYLDFYVNAMQEY